MRPQWRLAINSLWQRPSRTLLLTAVVALSAALICAPMAMARGACELALDHDSIAALDHYTETGTC